MKIAPLAPNILGVDTIATLSPFECRALVNLGYQFRCGYLDSMTPAEMRGQLSAGLPLLLYTYGNHFDAEHALLRCKALDVPQGAHIVLDVEGVTATGLEPAALVNKINAWGERMKSQTFLPCMYYAEDVLLTSEEISALAVYRYHQGAARIRDRNGRAMDPMRGAALIQGRPVNVRLSAIPGKPFDVNFHRHDYHGDGFSAIVGDS